MNVVIDYESENIDLFFIADVNLFSVDSGSASDIISFFNGNKYWYSIERDMIIEMMTQYIPMLEIENDYIYITKRNIKHWNIIKQRIFNVLLEAHKNNTDVYIVQEIKNIIKEYFESKGIKPAINIGE